MRERKAILGNREHRKSRFCFWGTGEKGHLFQGNKGTGTPPSPTPTGRASLLSLCPFASYRMPGVPNLYKNLKRQPAINKFEV